MQTFSCTQVQCTDHTSSCAKPAAREDDDFKRALAGVMQAESSVSGKDTGASRSDVSGAGSKSGGRSAQPEDQGQDKQSGITGLTDTSLLARLMTLQTAGLPVANGAGAQAAQTAGNTAAGAVPQAVSGNYFTDTGSSISQLQTMGLTQRATVPSAADQDSDPIAGKAETGSVQDILARLGASGTEMACVRIGIKDAAVTGNHTQGGTAAMATGPAMPPQLPKAASAPNTGGSVPTGQSTGIHFASVPQGAQPQASGAAPESNPAGPSAQAVAAIQTDTGAVNTAIVTDTGKGRAGTQTGAESAAVSVSDSVKPVQAAQAAAKASAGSTAKEDGGKQQDKTDGASVIHLYSHQTAQTAVTETGVTQKVDTADIARQIGDACKTAADTGKSEIRIHLSPEELGGINIKIVSQNGALSVQISADSRHTGEMLAQSMGDLNRSMSDHGVGMNKVEILYAQTGSFSSQLGSGSGGQQNYSGQSGSATTWVAMQQTPAEPENGGIEAVPASDSAAGYSRMSIFA